MYLRFECCNEMFNVNRKNKIARCTKCGNVYDRKGEPVKVINHTLKSPEMLVYFPDTSIEDEEVEQVEL